MPKIGKYGAMGIATFVVPFVAWALGAIANPTGWMSDSPLNALLFLAIIISVYWPVALGLAVVFLVVCWRYPKSAKTVFVPLAFALSLLYSIFLYMSVSTAEENEFTG